MVNGKQWMVNGDWTLFLDRDGVINQRIPGRYVADIEEFVFWDGALEAMRFFAKKFEKIIVVTNQQGIGKGLMTDAQLAHVHAHMREQIELAGGRIDAIYYCPKLAKDNPECRKPNIGMALQAQADFPDIDFEKSIMVGDSVTDMQFGLKLNMKTVFIQTKPEDFAAAQVLPINLYCKKIYDIIPCLSFC